MEDRLKLFVVLGTRPNFTKHLALQRACKLFSVNCVTAHTGQHFDANMSDVFFDRLNLETPNYTNTLSASTPYQKHSQIVEFVTQALKTEKPEACLVYGDVLSTAAGALAAKRCGVPVIHVEAGVRTSDLNNPEEHYRRITEKCAHTLFAHTRDAYNTLLELGRKTNEVFYTGDIVKDSLQLIRETNGIEVLCGEYFVVTLHRAENTDDRQRLTQICAGILDSPRPIRFPVHPRTRLALEHFGLWRALADSPHIELLEPLGYVEGLRLLAGCEKVISDSGGIRREAYMLGKPVVSLIELIWVPAMVRSGWEFIAGADVKKIMFGLNEFEAPTQRPNIFGDGYAAEKMITIILERYSPDYERPEHFISLSEVGDYNLDTSGDSIGHIS